MIIRLFVLSVFGLLGCAVLACDKVDDGSSAVNNSELLVADNNRKERRDDRQDDRDGKQDCRQDEGRVGDDKRECKQENRGDGDKDSEGAEADG